MREIIIEINGQFIKKSSKHGGVAGEGNVTAMRLMLDESWAGFGKRIIWRNSRGQNSVPYILGYEQMNDDTALDYTVLIPPEPLEYSGWCAFTLEGYSEDGDVVSVALSVTDRLEVKAGVTAKVAEPTASQALQLQHEIEAIMDDVTSGVHAVDLKAQEAAENAEISAESAQIAIDSLAEMRGVEGRAYVSADNAAESAEASGESAVLSESWAIGGTGARADEDINNAKYWANEAKAAAGGGVNTFNGRSGTVIPQSGDYTASQVGADPSGSAAAVQNSLNAHAAQSNPHATTKADIGLGAVDNTSDLNKPISSAMQTALNAKAASSHSHAASNITTGTMAGAVQAQATAQATLGNMQVRNISAGTADLEAGVSALATGQIYLVYEA